MDGTPESEYRVLEDLARMKVDGIIHFPLNMGVEYIRYFKQLRIPLVQMCDWLDDEFSFVGVNEKNAMNQAVAYVRSAGLQPPIDYGLVGFDSISILRYVHPRLATMAYPLAELVQKALEQMFWLLGGGRNMHSEGATGSGRYGLMVQKHNKA